jgi:branched-chain amino acid transport system substrate-binding protein
MIRVRIVAAALAAVALAPVALTACGSGSGSGGSGNKAGSPLVVGYLTPLTGSVAANGLQEKEGWNLAMSQLGAKVDGHPIVTYFEDTGSSPAVALSDARFLVESKHVNVVEGPLLASQIAPVAKYLGPLGVPLDNLAICGASQLVVDAKYGNAMSSGWVCNTPDIIAADYMYGLGYRHVTVVATDYAFGWLSAGGFITRFKQLGGSIDKTLWPPLTSTDFSPYVSAIPRSTQAVFTESLGTGAVDFTKAYAQFGLRGKIPLVGNTTTFDYSVLPHESAASVLGGVMLAQYCDGISTSANTSFVSAFTTAYGVRPGYYAEAGYVHAELLINAIKKLGGNFSSPAAVANALKTTPITAPRGPVTLDTRTFAPVQNVYACKVTNVNGTLENVPFKTWTAVPPWGTLDYSSWLSAFKTDSTGQPAP